ncbi:PilZ domain-containing protein [Minwuia thermotolerans]|uniref:PilZ domain-containing protein n=1 Tax=Minwuia thermotolerans TaxID=2056226 RepID=A0A2M9FVY2_9PROT|nr:PilZ domain-containing protein [Minwuia thermotolerans]PJK27620.1 hypothetical protein CVT23_22180 [Minwuia thermotolerans]
MKHYESLAGGSGRSVYYRARRLRAAEVFSSELAVARLDGRPVQIENLSMSGIALIDGDANADWSERAGDSVPVEITLGGETAFSSPGLICRVEEAARGQLVGIRFVDDFLDMAALIRRHEQLLLKFDLDRPADVELEAVPGAYRTLCADVIHLLRRQKALLARFRVRANGHAPIPPEDMEDAYRACEAGLLRDWKTLWQRGEDIVGAFAHDSVQVRAIKRFTEQVLTPEFMDGPIWQRSFEKPLGYPGDFKIMRMVYAWAREGKDPYGQLLHRLGLEVAECIATRMVLVQQSIAETIRRRAKAGEVARIASLGCGPAKEVQNILQASRLDGAAAFTLIDQEEEALAHAYEEAMPNLARLGGQASVNCLHLSFRQLLSGRAVAEALGPQDMIYAVGLVDYFRERQAQRLIAGLYGHVEPGGLLMIGNMADSALSNYWPMEFIADWNVIYRSREEMQRLAADCAGAEVTVRPDRTGRVWMLQLRRPDAA